MIPVTEITAADIKFTMVVEVDCRVCGQAVWPDDRVLSWQEAAKVRDDHIREHAEGQWG